MKNPHWFSGNRFFSHLRIASGGALFIAAAIAVLAAMNPALVRAGSAQKTYIVLYKTQSVSMDAANVIAKAGGVLVANYNAIGVVIARSDNDAFRSNLMKNSAIQGVAATERFATRLPDEGINKSADALVTPNTPAPGSDNLSGLQWDMDQIHAPEARAINGGSSSILVGDIDVMSGCPHEGAHDGFWEKEARCIAGFDARNLDIGRHADDADAIHCRGNRARGVRAMAVVIVRRDLPWYRRTRYAVHAGSVIHIRREIGMRIIETCINVANKD